MYRRAECNSEYEVLEEIGRGSFGAVRKVIHKATNTTMVRKEIKYGHMNHKERQQLISECKILSQLNHENIVKFHSWDFNERLQVLYLYMEYCSNGDLSQLISLYKNEHKYIPEQIIWVILTQLLLALYRCHYGEDPATLVTIYDRMKLPSGSKNIVIHRDLKPGNIFLDGNKSRTNNSAKNGSSAVGTVKLGDFGLAKALGNSIQFATTYVGTPYYMSPEVLRDQPYSPLSDVWSLGCVVYEMCSLHPPFQAKNYSELQNKIKLGRFDNIPEYYSDGLMAIIKSMIKTDMNDRASIFELLQDIQIRTTRKSLQLEKFERNLLDYEQELVNIEKILEKQAIDYERTVMQLKEQFGEAVEERTREVLNGKKIGKIPDSIIYSNEYNKKLYKPAYHWQTRYR
ncbi:hypothetical protein KAFR_0C00920 [Kazachstania africana CBS 2517]|uniref:non-specific serine/threonine protein kinase n=1 Tax=Kazachstania africana (strain ATCC 22294 / BCRC 22015 / CBS 2517 / CECT 1963 / NBRC 1671 / NRRL Y-8276) TaxID=1071382 RepID=H2ART7_KAZAF|nr:hypothetical protein KAFR_0C00920 [Kazachstania africana CBS 2517]CCF57087.1 hypothetical protein KAFR_0C00920 [Kazachstania africana CBS 2517]